MKNLIALFAILLISVSLVSAQRIDSRKNNDNYTGKRFDGYGKELDKKHRAKRKSTSELGSGDYKSKPYPIGIDQKRKKKKSNFKGKKRKKSCNCPGH